MACFCTSVELKAFLAIFIIMTLSLCVKCRNGRQKQYEAICKERLRKRVKLQCSEAEKKCAHEWMPHATDPQIWEHYWAILCRSMSQSHGSMNGWTMLISTGDLTLNVKKLTKAVCLQNFKAYTRWRKGVKGEKHTRKVRIKKLRIAEKISQKAKSLTA